MLYLLFVQYLYVCIWYGVYSSRFYNGNVDPWDDFAHSVVVEAPHTAVVSMCTYSTTVHSFESIVCVFLCV